jgi:hypothetical protein
VLGIRGSVSPSQAFFRGRRRRYVPFVLALVPGTLGSSLCCFDLLLLWPCFSQIWVSRRPTRFNFSAFFHLRFFLPSPRGGRRHVQQLCCWVIFSPPFLLRTTKLAICFAKKSNFSVNLCSICMMPLEVTQNCEMA